MEQPAFFTLKAEETFPLATLCVTVTDKMMSEPEKFPNVLLPNEYQDAFHRLKKQLDLIRTEEEPILIDIPLDVYMSYAMMHTIIQAYWRLKTLIQYFHEEKIPFSKEKKDMEAFYYECKPQAADLLLRLTKVWDYSDYGLMTLETLFDLKPAIRPLQVDNKKEITILKRNQLNKVIFQFAFHLLDFLIYYRAHYNFAADFYNYRFIHLNDYRELKTKLLANNRKKNIYLTLRDNIALYCVINLLGKFFLSDASDVYNEFGKETKTENLLRSKDLTMQEMRSFILKFTDHFLKNSRESMRQLPAEYALFKQQINKLNEEGSWKNASDGWQIQIDS